MKQEIYYILTKHIYTNIIRTKLCLFTSIYSWFYYSFEYWWLLLFRIILECRVSFLNDNRRAWFFSSWCGAGPGGLLRYWAGAGDCSDTELELQDCSDTELELEDCLGTKLELEDCWETELKLQDCSTGSGFRRPAIVFTAALLVEIYCCVMDGFFHINALRFGKNHFLNEYWIYSKIWKALCSNTH